MDSGIEAIRIIILIDEDDEFCEELLTSTVVANGENSFEIFGQMCTINSSLSGEIIGIEDSFRLVP